MKIGILAIQGSVIEHQQALERAAKPAGVQIEIQLVRSSEDLSDLSGIILPGGESTVQRKLLRRFDLFDSLQRAIKNGLPVYGTCAGAILLSKYASDDMETLGVMDIETDRNAYGSHMNSFIISFKFLDKEIEAVFIRAPKIKPLSDSIEILAEYNGEPTLMKQESILVSSFHPELTENTLVHEYFLELCYNASEK